MALSPAIARTGIVQAIMSATEWNEIVAEQGATGANGIGVSLDITLQ